MSPSVNRRGRTRPAPPRADEPGPARNTTRAARPGGGRGLQRADGACWGTVTREAAQAAGGLRESLTSLVAFGTAADLQVAEMGKAMAEFGAIFYGGDVTVSARLLRRHLSAQQRAELTGLITAP